VISYRKHSGISKLSSVLRVISEIGVVIRGGLNRAMRKVTRKTPQLTWNVSLAIFTMKCKENQIKEMVGSMK